MAPSEGVLVKPTRTWIVIADGSGARILQVDGDGRIYLEQAVINGRHLMSTDGLTQMAPPQQAQMERPGAAKVLENLFASQLAAILAAQLRNGAFDRLVLIAPCTMLEKLAKMIHPDVRGTVIFESDKDLTNVPGHEIVRSIREVVPLPL